MIDNSKNNPVKQAELKKYRDLVLAAIDYLLEKHSPIRTADFDSHEHFNKMKILTEENFKKGRLNLLKQWFRDLCEMKKK